MQSSTVSWSVGRVWNVVSSVITSSMSVLMKSLIVPTEVKRYSKKVVISGWNDVRWRNTKRNVYSERLNARTTYVTSMWSSKSLRIMMQSVDTKQSSARITVELKLRERILKNITIYVSSNSSDVRTLNSVVKLKCYERTTVSTSHKRKLSHTLFSSSKARRRRTKRLTN